jgi:hypothetical protein
MIPLARNEILNAPSEGIHNRTFLTAVWASHCWREGVSMAER